MRMDLFNVFKRYAHFGEQNQHQGSDKMAKSWNVCFQNKRENRMNILYSYRSMHTHLFGQMRLNSLQTIQQIDSRQLKSRSISLSLSIWLLRILNVKRNGRIYVSGNCLVKTISNNGKEKQLCVDK